MTLNQALFVFGILPGNIPENKSSYILNTWQKKIVITVSLLKQQALIHGEVGNAGSGSARTRRLRLNFFPLKNYYCLQQVKSVSRHLRVR